MCLPFLERSMRAGARPSLQRRRGLAPAAGGHCHHQPLRAAPQNGAEKSLSFFRTLQLPLHIVHKKRIFLPQSFERACLLQPLLEFLNRIKDLWCLRRK